jgi:hypothetical protein
MKKQQLSRETLIALLKRGMEYPAGKHRLWVSRCFEITVDLNQKVNVDEYEEFTTELGLCTKQERPNQTKKGRQMYHVGRSVLNLKGGKVIEERGEGWA